MRGKAFYVDIEDLVFKFAQHVCLRFDFLSEIGFKHRKYEV